MTLKEYEEKLQEKRKVLESMKMQKRRVTLDKDFESMHIIEKKDEETIFVKLVSLFLDVFLSCLCYFNFATLLVDLHVLCEFRTLTVAS